MDNNRWEWEHVGGTKDGLIRTYKREIPDGTLFLTVIDGPVGVAGCAQTFVINELDMTPLRIAPELVMKTAAPRAPKPVPNPLPGRSEREKEKP